MNHACYSYLLISLPDLHVIITHIVALCLKTFNRFVCFLDGKLLVMNICLSDYL